MRNEITTHSSPLITSDHLQRFAVIYLRQSTLEQVQKNTGSTTHQRNLTGTAREYGWEESRIITIDEDLGRSGSTIRGRTGWDRLQQMIEANQVGAVFVANVSRLARQVHDFELFRMRAALHHTLLYSDGRLGDPADSNDAIVSQIMAMIAQFENRKRAEIMMQSKMAKAKRGEVVSRLPVGWVKGPDGKYDYDPETEKTIRAIIDTFRQTQTIYRTVKMLAKAGIQIPCRKAGGQLDFKIPTETRVKFILTHPAYTGSYVFARTEQGEPLPTSGRLKRVKRAGERWIKIPNHHPVYMTIEEQEQIKSILQKNQFKRRSPVARERVMIQGLLRCARCGASVSVHYPSNKLTFYKCRRLRDYAEKACMTFTSNDLDECILRQVFKVLEAPPLETLKAALEISRKEKQTRLSWIQSERERLAREEGSAQDRADLTRGNLPTVHFDALQKLEKVLQEKTHFEQKVASEPVASSQESEEELDELCRIATEVSTLWHHKAVTNQERQQIVRCLIDHIIVEETKERIDATIVWKSGGRTPVVVWRAHSRRHLIRELHAEQLTTSEIRERLALGKTSTGQVVNISLAGVEVSLRRMGLRAARHSSHYFSVHAKAVELDRDGQSLKSIAQYFNEQKFASPSGKPWTHFMVANLLRANGGKQASLESIHRSAISEARARGLSYEETARKLNTTHIRRRGGLSWTANSVAFRWRDLKRMQRKRATKDCCGPEETQPSAT